MLRIFRVMVSLSWAGVGVNHNFWNVSLTSFCKTQVYVYHIIWLEVLIKKAEMHRMGMHKWKCDKINVNPYLYSFLIIDPANHLYTHLSDFAEGWLFQTNVSEYFDHPLPDADTSVLYYQKRKKILILREDPQHKRTKTNSAFNLSGKVAEWSAMTIVRQ